MTLSIEASLLGVIDMLNERVAPAVEDHYVRETIRMAQSVLRISARAIDDAVALRVAENAALRALFVDAAGLVEGDFADRLAQAGRSADPDLRISSLDAENERLRVLLIELHSGVELREDAPGRAFNQRIWALIQKIDSDRAPRA